MAKKIFVFIIFISFIALSCLVNIQSSFAQKIELESGDLIKGSGPSVYYYTIEGGMLGPPTYESIIVKIRYAYPLESIFFTWQSDFSNIKVISDEQLAQIKLRGNILVRPGTKLVKIKSIPKVYAVEPHGMLRHIVDEETARRLYGVSWYMKVIDIPDSFWGNYHETDRPLDGSQYPYGQMVKSADSPDVYYVDSAGGWSKIANEEIFNQYRFRIQDIVTAPADMAYEIHREITIFDWYSADDSQGPLLF